MQQVLFLAAFLLSSWYLKEKSVTYNGSFWQDGNDVLVTFGYLSHLSIESLSLNVEASLVVCFSISESPTQFSENKSPSFCMFLWKQNLLWSVCVSPLPPSLCNIAWRAAQSPQTCSAAAQLVAHDRKQSCCSGCRGVTSVWNRSRRLEGSAFSYWLVVTPHLNR